MRVCVCPELFHDQAVLVYFIVYVLALSTDRFLSLDHVV